MWGFLRNKTALASLVLTAALTIPAWGSNSDARTALPGTLNYVEGQASINHATLNAKSVGNADLQAGQVLATENGKAEILLTPGVFLRLGDNSEAKMITPDLTNTQLAVNKGEAMIEVDEIHPENDIQVTEDGASTRLLKTGLYDFDAAHDQIRVFSGKAQVLDGDHRVTVKGGHELALNSGSKLKAKGFDKKEYGQNDDLYRWSSLRSDYLAEANVNTAPAYIADGWYGPDWFGGGWYWSPWYGAYTFFPEDGFLYSPFGWGFYSPLWAYRSPVYGVGPNYYHHFQSFRPVEREARGGPIYGPGFHGGAVRSFNPPSFGGPSGGWHGPEMHSAPVMRGPSGFGGGFHGSMGGGHGAAIGGNFRR